MKRNVDLTIRQQTEEEKRENILTFVVSSSKVDGHGTIIDQNSMITDRFEKGGSLTLWHSDRNFPVAKPVILERYDDMIISSFKFDLLDEMSIMSYKKLLFGSLVNCSLEGIKGKETYIEIKENLPDTIYYLYLTGLSVVITPSNSDCVVTNVNRGKVELIDFRQSTVKSEERKVLQKKIMYNAYKKQHSKKE